MHAQLQARHAEMMRLHFDEGWSIGAVARTCKRSPAMVKKLVRQERQRGRVRTCTVNSPDPRRKDNRRPLSAVHACLGIVVARHRSRARLSMTEFGLRVGLSRIRVSELEAGSYDPSLCELQAICAELDIDIAAAVTPTARAPQTSPLVQGRHLRRR